MPLKLVFVQKIKMKTETNKLIIFPAFGPIVCWKYVTSGSNTFELVELLFFKYDP